MEQPKIILDTDIGDDIDDALALAYAQLCGAKLLGVTTVFRNARRRAQMASALLHALGAEDVPVRAGVDLPFVQPLPRWNCDAFTAENEFIPCQYLPEMQDESVSSQHAVDFILETVAANPGEITLVPIGPLTNIAMAIRKAPDVMAKLRGITLMGGCFQRPQAEWNILCDPEAAHIVFSSGIPLRAVGIDLTERCRVDSSFRETLQTQTSPAAKLLHGFVTGWRKNAPNDEPILHDPLAVATLFSDRFVRFAAKPIRVDLDDARGQTLATDSDSGTAAEIGVDVDEKAFLQDFCEKLQGV